MSEDRVLIEKLMQEQTLFLQNQIHKSSEMTIASVLEHMMPSIEKEMEIISERVAYRVSRKVVLDVTGEDYDDVPSRRRIREGVQWAIKACAKNIHASNAVITVSIAGTCSIISGLILHYLKG